jgi:hypothetical protein
VNHAVAVRDRSQSDPGADGEQKQGNNEFSCHARVIARTGTRL